MEKRKLSAIPRAEADPDMLEAAGRLEGMRYIVTAELADAGGYTVLLLYFYIIEELKKGNTGAAFRTFLSADDYITQDLRTPAVRWKTASFYMMDGLKLWAAEWDTGEKRYRYSEYAYIRTSMERDLISDFFSGYTQDTGWPEPWDRVYAFQKSVMERRLAGKHKKETDRIDALMDTVGDIPGEFKEWAYEKALGFSRYIIYRDDGKGGADCFCTWCRGHGKVSRRDVRLRNDEKGSCPFCGSPATIKAAGKMPWRIHDSRWVVFTEPREDGFLWRYFYVWRDVYKMQGPLWNQDGMIRQGLEEGAREFVTFHGNREAVSDVYEYTQYKQTRKTRWCHVDDRKDCWECILYPCCLPGAWAHTPMKYSALELLSVSLPTMAVNYGRAVKAYLKFPKLEWFLKMGLNRLACTIISGHEEHATGRINKKGGTIFEILGLDRLNTRILQEIDGNADELRLLQASQAEGYRFTAEGLKEYYEAFGCNTGLLRKENRRTSLHKLVKYIKRESERYPAGDADSCRYAYMRYQEREDPRIRRQKNTAADWLDYIGWCREMNYDTGNMFIYMPTNFRRVHDRTAEEYKRFKAKKDAAEKKRQEVLAAKRLAETRKAIGELLSRNEGADACALKGNGLVLVVPKSGEEIKAEGEALHHCVGTYVDRVARGETSIFFIRKEKEPEKPYFTMEYKDRVVQCRGRNNCSMPPDVEAFSSVFEKKMKEAGRGGSRRRKKGGRTDG